MLGIRISTMQLDWFKLLDYNYKHGRFGLTLPFLLGSLRIPPGRIVNSEHENFIELLALLKSMRDHAPDSYYIKIAECGKLSQPVATRQPSLYFSPASTSKAISSPLHNRTSLYVQPKYLVEESRGIDSVAESIWAASAEVVMSGEFSFRNGAFCTLDVADILFIKSALSENSEDES